MCGNIDTLQAKDFVKVPPGGAFSPASKLHAHTFREPGAYRLRFVYLANSNDIGDWSGDDRARVAADAALADLFKQVPKVEVRSNEFVLTVVGPP